MATLLLSAADVFGAVFAHESIREIPFDAKFNNGTGYFDAIVQADLGLMSGEIARMETPAPNCRKILVMGSPVGNLAIFQRYTNGQGGVYVSNVPRCIEGLFELGSKIEDRAMARLFGQVIGENFSEFNLKYHTAGKMLEPIADYFASKAKASDLIDNGPGYIPDHDIPPGVDPAEYRRQLDGA